MVSSESYRCTTGSDRQKEEDDLSDLRVVDIKSNSMCYESTGAALHLVFHVYPIVAYIGERVPSSDRKCISNYRKTT